MTVAELRASLSAPTILSAVPVLAEPSDPAKAYGSPSGEAREGTQPAYTRPKTNSRGGAQNPQKRERGDAKWDTTSTSRSKGARSVQPASAPTLPHSLEAEQGVLGSIFCDPAFAIPVCARSITPDHFFFPANQIIYREILAVAAAGNPIDLVSFTIHLRDANLLDKIGGPIYPTQLSHFVSSTVALEFYLGTLREKHLLRELYLGGHSIQASALLPDANPSQILSAAEENFSKLHSLNGKNDGGLRDGADILDEEIVIPPDVIEGVLHKGGKMVLGGGSKSFKTWTLIDVCVSVTTGSDWFTGIPTKQGRVLYVNFELPRAYFELRLQRVCDARQLRIDRGMLHVWHLRGREKDWDKLQLQIQRDYYSLAILDPMYKLLLGRDENKAGDIALLMAELEQFALRTKAAIAFGAHYSKGNQAQKVAMDRIGGSGVFARDPDSIINFTQHEQDQCFSVEMTLRNHPPRDPFVVRWDFPLFHVESFLDPNQLRQVGRPEIYHAEDILALISQPMTAAEIVRSAYEDMQISRRRVFQLLVELKKAGKIKQDSNRGKYEPC